MLLTTVLLDIHNPAQSLYSSVIAKARITSHTDGRLPIISLAYLSHNFYRG
jgi:hypothetical protein